jgi:adenylosuccinate lyase
MARELAPQWALLGEAVQTILRKHHVPQAYEKLKDLTQGKEVNQATMADFVAKLEIPADDKKVLAELTPATYVGLAAELAKRV